jgi:hypothetical protein
MHARRCRAIDTRTHIHPSIRACARVWLQTNADGAADVRVRIMASVHASMHERRYRRTLYGWAYHIPARAHAHPYKYMCSYIRTQMYARGDTRLVGARVCRSRRALTRTYEHAHTLAWNLHAHTYAKTCTHTTHTHMVTPI